MKKTSELYNKYRYREEALSDEDKVAILKDLRDIDDIDPETKEAIEDTVLLDEYSSMTTRELLAKYEEFDFLKKAATGIGKITQTVKDTFDVKGAFAQGKQAVIDAQQFAAKNQTSKQDTMNAFNTLASDSTLVQNDKEVSKYIAKYKAILSLLAQSIQATLNPPPETKKAEEPIPTTTEPEKTAETQNEKFRFSSEILQQLREEYLFTEKKKINPEALKKIQSAIQNVLNNPKSTPEAYEQLINGLKSKVMQDTLLNQPLNIDMSKVKDTTKKGLQDLLGPNGLDIKKTLEFLDGAAIKQAMSSQLEAQKAQQNASKLTYDINKDTPPEDIIGIMNNAIKQALAGEHKDQITPYLAPYDTKYNGARFSDYSWQDIYQIANALTKVNIPIQVDLTGIENPANLTVSGASLGTPEPTEGPQPSQGSQSNPLSPEENKQLAGTIQSLPAESIEKLLNSVPDLGQLIKQTLNNSNGEAAPTTQQPQSPETAAAPNNTQADLLQRLKSKSIRPQG